MPGKVAPRLTITVEPPSLAPPIGERFLSPPDTTRKALLIQDSTLTPRTTTRVMGIFNGESHLAPGKTGKNGSLILSEIEDGSPRGLFKFSALEIGTELSLGLHPDAIASKLGILPGEGAFGEYLGNLVMQRWVAQALIPSHQIAIEHSAWVKIEHPDLRFPLLREGVLRSVMIDGKGCLHQFEPNCITFANAQRIHPEWIQELSAESVHMLAFMMLALVNTDGNGGNLLLRRIPEGTTTLIPIDLACILPREGRSNVTACWKDLPQLEEPLSDSLKAFILNPEIGNVLEEELRRLKSEGIEEARIFDEDRLFVHRIAVHLIQAGVAKGLTLGQISKYFIQATSFDCEKAVEWIHKNQIVTGIPLSELCNLFTEVYVLILKKKQLEGESLRELDYTELFKLATTQLEERLSHCRYLNACASNGQFL